MTLVTGSTTGSWTLLKPDTTRRYHWQCRCTCGNTKSIRDSSLKNGKSSSCGCVRTQVLSNRKTHGMTNTVEYGTWQWMRARVRHKPGYENRTICPRWQEFENFYMDMGTRPDGENISLGRIDNDGPLAHELLVARLEHGKTADDLVTFMTSTPPPGPQPYRSVGGFQSADAGFGGWATLDLTAGDYVFFCNLPDARTGKRHFEEGMLHQVAVR